VYEYFFLQAFKSFDDLLHHPLILSTEPAEHSWILNRQERTVCNALMASVPGHPFWLHVLQEVGKRSSITDPVRSDFFCAMIS
jgi:mannosyltransferase OCH1-like enzyme